MKLLHTVGNRLFQLFSLLFVIGYFLGILNIYFSDKNDYCVMTYMFEYPQFVRVSVPESKEYPQYGLYAYSEGRFTERARKMWFDGVPVLYLPGNSGSHMQARSLASVALRKSLERGYEFHFDFFTVSYNEELSGLYGGVLQSQTKFAAACITRILSLYKTNKYTKTVPTTVVLIGHSMGGLIAKRLLVYPNTLDTTSIAIALAAPLEAPVINFDTTINDYYMLMQRDWNMYSQDGTLNKNKILLSFGNGARDLLMPSRLTFSNDSYINALTTAIPGVWVSPDHVSIVWCKQLVIAINRFLFSAVDTVTEQITDDKQLIMAKANEYFQANRSMKLDRQIKRANNVPMQVDAFWYEDNRRVYQITRPEINKTTYLMIRLATFHQNRFVAVEAVNLDDKDWIFACNAKFSQNTYRYCKHATSLTELSRWTGAAVDFGKRKLATIHLHSIKEENPEWTHAVVKVSPTRKPIVLNVDINDHASREITVNLPFDFSFTKSIIKQETESGSLYYELLLPGFDKIHQSYLLYVEPTNSCKGSNYHVSAELHVPWAENHEYFHFFTQSKRSPMKLRLFRTNPNITLGLEPTRHAKVTLLLDPQCTYTISISASWYHRLAQLARNYTPVLIPYIASIVILAAGVNIRSLKDTGRCLSIHSALMSEGVKPYYALVFSRLGTMVFGSIPILSFLFENASWNNIELQYFTRSVLVLPVYMTALGIVNIAAAGILAVMMFSSQLAHRLLFRIVWRGSSGLAEKVATGLQKIPLVVSVALVCAAPVSCGAASLAAGAAFYAFMLSKMYEEYLEDYVYKIMAKVASRFGRVFRPKSKKNKNTSLVNQVTINENNKDNIKSKEEKKENNLKIINKDDRITDNAIKDDSLKVNDDKDDKIIFNAVRDDLETKLLENSATHEELALANVSKQKDKQKDSESDTLNSDKSNKGDEQDTGKDDSEIDENLNNLHFHMMMFFLWMVVAIVNIPALLTWARNFKYSMILRPDTSYHTGLAISVCSGCLWQVQGPRRNLRYDDAVTSMLFTMAVFILALGPMSLSIVNYGVTLMFCLITIQQVFDKQLEEPDKGLKTPNDGEPCIREDDGEEQKSSAEESSEEKVPSGSGCDKDESGDSSQGKESEQASDDCTVSNENRIYSIYKNLRDKFTLHEEL